MRISSVRPHLVNAGPRKTFIFVKVETDEGMHGWGEAFTQADRDRRSRSTSTQMARYLIGRDPFTIKHFTPGDVPGLRRQARRRWTSLLRRERHRAGALGHRRQGDRPAGLQPAWRALPRQDSGLRQRLGRRRDDAGGRRAIAKRDGRSRVHGPEVRPVPNPWRDFISREQERHGVDTVRAVREAVGPESTC